MKFKFSRKEFLNSTESLAGLTLLPCTYRNDSLTPILIVFEIGAKVNGITDDSEAIQEARNYITKNEKEKYFFLQKM